MDKEREFLEENEMDYVEKSKIPIGIKLVMFLGGIIFTPIIIYSFYYFNKVYQEYSKVTIDISNMVYTQLFWAVTFAMILCMFIMIFYIAVSSVKHGKTLDKLEKMSERVLDLTEELHEVATIHEVKEIERHCSTINCIQRKILVEEEKVFVNQKKKIGGEID